MMVFSVRCYGFEVQGPHHDGVVTVMWWWKLDGTVFTALLLGPQWPSPGFARFGLKHQLSIDGDLNVVSHDDTGTLAREFPTQAKVLSID
jgi:hypothetical protein